MHKCKGKEINLDYSSVELAQAAELLKIFADPTRMKIMVAMHNNELAVCDLAKTTGLSHSLTSHQLAALKKFNVVKSVKNGKNVYYRLYDKCAYQMLALAVNHVRHNEKKELIDEESISD